LASRLPGRADDAGGPCCLTQESWRSDRWSPQGDTRVHHPGNGAGAVIGALTPLGALITGSFGVAGSFRRTRRSSRSLTTSPRSLRTSPSRCSSASSLSRHRATDAAALRVSYRSPHAVQATVLTVVLYNAHVEPVVQILVAAFGLATMMVIMPRSRMPWMKKVTGNQPVAMGHFGSFGYIAAGETGQLVAAARKHRGHGVPTGPRFLRDRWSGRPSR